MERPFSIVVHIFFPAVFLAALVSSGCSAKRGERPAFLGSEPETSDFLQSEGKDDGRYRPVAGSKGMVVSDDREASEWGVSLLKDGGNAMDAAVGTAFALAVSRPHYAALGGGGFIVTCPAPIQKKPQPCQTIDYRERAPLAATRDMFVRDGKGVTDLSQHGALASGVPGVVSGLLLALDQFGTMSREDVLKRPIEMAEKGVPYSLVTQHAARKKWEHMNGEAKEIFGCGARKKELQPCPVGTKLRQPDLARVLRRVRDAGTAGFYRGSVAAKIAGGIQKAGGILTRKDLSRYQARIRRPLVGTYQGLEVVTMPPPSAGGTGLLQMLVYTQLADEDGAFAHGFGSTASLHALTHAMSLAFADRAQYFGDPDHVDVPLARLLDPGTLRERWNSTYKTGEANIPEGPGELKGLQGHEPLETTHFSVIDAQGNAVALTTTVNGYFGSGFVPPGTGVVMNNEMDDFSIQPGVPNLFGLVGAEANAVAPGKRPLSSMTPTVVRDSDGNARLVLGAQGGPRITTSVFHAIVNRIEFGMTLPDAIHAPRSHHQWKPASLMVERHGFSVETLSELSGMGYEVKLIDGSGRMQAIERFPDGRVWGVSDPRTEGAAVAEY